MLIDVLVNISAACSVKVTDRIIRTIIMPSIAAPAMNAFFIFISIPFAPLKAQNAMKKQVVSQRFSFYNSCHRNKRYTTNHGEVSGLSSLLDDRIFICVGCFFKHK